MKLASPAPRRENLIKLAVALMLGIAMIAGGALVSRLKSREQATLIVTPGTVVDNERRSELNSDRKPVTKFVPVIEFMVNGDARRFTGDPVSFESAKGNLVVVRYDPALPAQSARVVEPLEDVTPIAMYGIGGFVIISALVAWVRKR